MSATLVARKDFDEAVRSRLLWGLVAVFVLFVGLIVYVFQTVVENPTAARGIAAIVVPAQVVVPIAGLVVGYMAIVGERRTGSIKLLAGLPVRRRDVVLGKLLGRTAVMGLGVGAGFLVGGVLLFAFLGSLPLAEFVGFAALTVLFALAFVGTAVGISAAVATRGRALALALGAYLVCNFFWEAISAGVYYVVNGSIPGLRVEAWYFGLKHLSPMLAYVRAAHLVFDTEVNGIALFRIEDLSGASGPAAFRLSNRVVGDLPVYLEEWFSIVVLAGWIAVPILVGYLRFRTADLG